MLRTLTISSLIALALGFTAGQAQGGQRIWHYTDGRTFTAEYLWAGPETIYLKNTDGKEFQLALGSLSNDDLGYVRALARKLKAKGIIFEAPLEWEEFRSKNFTSQEADKAGYYPIDSRVTRGGSLRLEFRRFGDPPKLALNHQVVLRMTTANRGQAGTNSQIRIIQNGKVTGATSAGVAANSTFDIPLSPLVLKGGLRIIFDVKCGPDAVLVRTRKSGAGPRLLIVEKKPPDAAPTPSP